MRKISVVFLEVWEEIHGHSGINKSYEKFHARFWMNGGEKWIRQKCRECVHCAHKNNKIWPAETAPLKPIETVAKPFWRVHGNKHI